SSQERKQSDSETVCKDQGEWCRLLDLMSESQVLPSDRNKPVTDKDQSCEGNPSDANGSDPFPTRLAVDNAGELLESQQLETESRLPDPEEVTALESALDSCTVVEGLLFPVEYYVRTTRRMSSCQRKVDLSAVILSQLGRSKKGQRSKCKQRDANPAQPSQERVETDLESGAVLCPFLCAENDPANVSSPQKSLPASSGSSASLGSVSQSSATSKKRDQRRSQRKQKVRRTSGCAPAVHQVSQEGREGLGLRAPREGSTVLPGLCQSEQENCEADLGNSSSEEQGACSNPVGSGAPVPLGLPTLDADTGSSLFPFRSPQWVASALGVQDFHLPDEEFGQLKLEKLESSPANDLEDFVPEQFGGGVPSKDTPEAQMNLEENSLRSNLMSPLKNGLPKVPHLESPTSKKELSTHELLFTPVGTVLADAPPQPESQISSSIFPVVGATPAVLPPGCSEIFPGSSTPPSQASPPSQGASARVVDDGERKDPAVPLPLEGIAAGSAREEQDQGTAFPGEAETHPDEKSDEAVALERHQQLESEQQRSGSASPVQKKPAAEQLTPAQLGGLAEESLQLMSKLKDSSSSCAVDVSAVWWEVAGSRELCVVTACEGSVSLWTPLAADAWGKVYTWQLGEMAVIQIVPLPDACNLMCVALGDLEIAEIRWLLLYSSENDSFKQSLLRSGNIKAVLGLKARRVVSSSRTACGQQVEVVSLSETGRSRDGRTLMPPEETVLGFAEVEGLQDALVGTTAANGVVVWNLRTGQLLRKMHLGYSYPASVCHRAYSDSGLLFVVLSHPHAKESESCRNPAFRVVAFNPKTARSTGVVFSSLPAGHAGRRGDVRDACAAAVLTSGAVAVWDLQLGHCTALLPPGPQGDWALARWATTPGCLLAGQRDGTVCLYRYWQPQPGGA
ncbi:PALB2 protein, partial [Centropus unirufus]|nr:PALB2 protein [Centropus unirufus]